MSEEHPITEPLASETLYGWLAGYGFARRYVGGKVVANFGREGLGYGSHVLSQTAEHVVGLTDSTEAADSNDRLARFVQFGKEEQ